MDEFEVTRRASVVSSIIAEKKLEEEKEDEDRRGLKGDYLNLCVLLLLYVLQGIPIGLLATIPMVFSANKVPYKQQAIFSFAGYPYAMKLLWAPIVDSVYSERFGRRKTWLIPSQYAIGIAMMTMAPFSDDLIGDVNKPPQIYWLTASTFFIVFLVATQDVAVDAWGLTLLSKRNVHYVASSNAVGVTVGAFLTTTVYMALESPKFCNQWLRSEPKDYGLVDMRELFFAVGTLFLVSTTVIWIFKREENVVDFEGEKSGVLNTYKLLLKVIRLKSVLSYILMQMTIFVGNGVFWAASDLKLIQYGVRREVLTLLKTPITILNFFLPFIVVRVTKNNPLHYFWRFGVARIFIQATGLGMLYWTQTFNQPKDGEFPWYYYTVMFVIMVIGDIIGYTSGMSNWAFMTSVADAKFGATYMTLFATIMNIGVKWVMTLSLALLDPVTIKREKVIYDTFNETTTTEMNINEYENTTIFSEYSSTMNSTAITKQYEVIVDGYYVQGVFCTVYALIWFLCFKRLTWTMQDWPESKWRIKKDIIENEDEAKSATVKLTNIRTSQLDDDYL